MKVLITGAAGYLGSVLTYELLRQGHSVIALDDLRYNQTSLAPACPYENFKFVKADCCDDNLPHYASECDFVIPLAAVVGAPACDEHKDEAARVNTTGVGLAVLAAKAIGAGVVVPNTNSGYGTTGRAACDETTPLNPISHYGRTKREAEELVLSSGGVALRFATLFGLSLRMRFDLLVNDFVFRAMRDKSLVLFEAHFRRNYLHVQDAADAIIWTMRNYKFMKGQAYNAGLQDANLTKRQLAECIKRRLPDLAIIESEVGSDPDKRDYLVDNSKLMATGWHTRYSIDDGIRELIKAYPMFSRSPYANV